MPPASISIIPTKQTIKLNPNPKPTLFKMPINKAYLETLPVPNLSRSKKARTSLNPALLKYQRYPEEKKKPDTHFKKKFYYREHWRDDGGPRLRKDTSR
ncbi:hypothetical protein NQ318_003486 [Aromia moschata]|uniref:Uncharacterized protein n=1 Tax=Aromia moschata TaxID=1265417 RepID=A0AAV8YV24_9CUCU|nr:hypothetical protein NQ318_003486 [Aromia moschata]